MGLELERCTDCGEPTDRAGAADDSIYTSEGLGPFCDECWDEGHAMDRLAARIAQLESDLDTLKAAAREYVYARSCMAVRLQDPSMAGWKEYETAAAALEALIAEGE